MARETTATGSVSVSGSVGSCCSVVGVVVVVVVVVVGSTIVSRGVG